MIKEHKNISLPLLTHSKRFLDITKSLTFIPLDTKDDLRIALSKWEQMGEALQDIGYDLENMGEWGLKVLELLGEEIERMP